MPQKLTAKLVIIGLLVGIFTGLAWPTPFPDRNEDLAFNVCEFQSLSADFQWNTGMVEGFPEYEAVGDPWDLPSSLNAWTGKEIRSGLGDQQPLANDGCLPDLMFASYDPETNSLILRFYGKIGDRFTDTWGTIGLTVDNGGKQTIWLKTPWAFHTGAPDDDELTVYLAEGQADLLETWQASQFNLKICIGAGVFRGMGGIEGNMSVSFVEDVRVRYLKPAKKAFLIERVGPSLD